MTTEPIVKIEGTDPQIIEKINHNFRVLTERMKDLNVNISYLDILHITDIYTVNDDTEGGTIKHDSETTERDFVVRYWNLLPNYAGVYITSFLAGELFQWQKQSVTSGSYIIKLPGNESIIVPGQLQQYYCPNHYDRDSGLLTYTLVQADDPSTNIPIRLTLSPATARIYTLTLSGNEADHDVSEDIPHVLDPDSTIQITSLQYYRTDNLEPIYIADTLPTNSLISNPCNFSVNFVLTYYEQVPDNAEEEE